MQRLVYKRAAPFASGGVDGYPIRENAVSDTGLRGYDTARAT